MAPLFAVAIVAALAVLVIVLLFPRLTDWVGEALGVTAAVVWLAGYLALPVVLVVGLVLLVVEAVIL